MSRPAPDPEYTLRGCDGPITCVLFLEQGIHPDHSPRDPEILICGTEQGTVYTWDLSRRRIRHQLQAHNKSILGLFNVTNLLGHSTGKQGTCTGMGTQVTQLGDADLRATHDMPKADPGQCLNSLESDVDGHVTRAVDTEGSVTDHVISQGRDGVLHLWAIQAHEWTLTRSYVCGSLGFCHASVGMVDGHAVIASSTAQDQADVAIINLRTGESMKIFSPSKQNLTPGMCMALMFIVGDGDTSSSSMLVAAYEDGRMALWDVIKEDLVSNVVVQSSSITCLDYSSKLNRGVCGSVDDSLVVWTIIRETSAISVLKTLKVTNPGLNCVRFRLDGKIFVSGGWDNKLRVFSSKSGKSLAVLSIHRDSVQCTGFSLNHTLAAGGKDGVISVWHVYK